MAHYDSGAVYGTFFYDEPDAPPPKKKMAKAKLELKKKTDQELLAFAQAHKAAMTGNANFTTPIPAAAAYDTAITNFNNALAALAAARTAVNQAMTNKETARTALEALTTQRGDYVDLTSGGDEAKIESSGFGVRGPSAPVGELPAPANLSSSYGDNDGEIDLSWNPVRGASSYQIECKINSDAGVWQHATNANGSSVTVKDLVGGTVYAFRVRANGAAGPGAWSDVNVRRAP